MLPQAPTSDTTGWFARDAATFAKVSSVMLGQEIPSALPTRLIVAVDAFGFADTKRRRRPSAGGRQARGLLGDWREEVMAPPGLSSGRAPSARCNRTRLGKPSAPGWTRATPGWPSRLRVVWSRGSMIPEGERAWASLMRQEARARMAYLLPPARSCACRRRRSRRRCVARNCRCSIPCAIASPASAHRADWPAIRRSSLPGAVVDGLPVGLSVIGPRGSDATLVAVARALGDGGVKDLSPNIPEIVEEVAACSSATSRR